MIYIVILNLQPLLWLIHPPVRRDLEQAKPSGIHIVWPHLACVHTTSDCQVSPDNVSTYSYDITLVFPSAETRSTGNDNYFHRMISVIWVNIKNDYLQQDTKVLGQQACRWRKLGQCDMPTPSNRTSNCWCL